VYAALAQISRPEINIITVEDPVEFRLPGVNQVQLNARPPDVRVGPVESKARRSAA
jgi:type IV pilus assembly protein PilB